MIQRVPPKMIRKHIERKLNRRYTHPEQKWVYCGKWVGRTVRIPILRPESTDSFDPVESVILYADSFGTFSRGGIHKLVVYWGHHNGTIYWARRPSTLSEIRSCE